jgi:hypothetical protein
MSASINVSAMPSPLVSVSACSGGATGAPLRTDNTVHTTDETGTTSDDSE